MTILLTALRQTYIFTDKAKDNTFYLEKINAYKTECGCTLGAISMMAAIIVYGVHFLFIDLSNINIAKSGLYGLFFVFLCTAVGKLIGIVIAKIKLKLLYKSLVQDGYLELVELN